MWRYLSAIAAFIAVSHSVASYAQVVHGTTSAAHDTINYGSGGGGGAGGNANYATTAGNANTANYATQAGSANALNSTSYCNPSASGYCYTFADTTHITLNANGLAALSIDGTLNSVFGGNVTLPSASMLTWLARTQLFAPSDGTLQVLTSTGTFGKFLLGAAGATTGVQFVPSSGQLRIQDGSGASAIQMLVNQVNATYLNVGGGALTFNGSGAAVGAVAASIYTPNTSTLKFALAATDYLTMTAANSTFSHNVLAPFFQATGGQGAFQSANTTATFANSGNTGTYISGNTLTIKTGNVTAVTIDANQVFTLKNGTTFADGNITTPLATTAVGPITGSTTALFGTPALGFQFWLNGGGTQLYITNGVGGTTVALNTGSIISHGTYTTTAVLGNMYVTGTAGYGLGAANGTSVSLYAGGSQALTFDSTQNATFNNGTVSGARTLTASKTANYTLTAADNAVHFDNTGATGAITLTLLTPTGGQNGCITTTAAQSVAVTTPSGAILGSSFTSGATRTTTAQYTTWCWEAHGGNYYIVQLMGTIAS